jgi:hypothetical protein
MVRDRDNSHRPAALPAADAEGVSTEPRYVIAAVASRVGVRVQTLR